MQYSIHSNTEIRKATKTFLFLTERNHQHHNGLKVACENGGSQTMSKVLLTSPRLLCSLSWFSGRIRVRLGLAISLPIYALPTPLLFFSEICVFKKSCFLENPREQAGGLTVWRTEPPLHFPSSPHSHYFFSEITFSKHLDFLDERTSGWMDLLADWFAAPIPSHLHTPAIFFRKSVFKNLDFSKFRVGEGKRVD